MTEQPKKLKYKLETWKQYSWKGTKREQIGTTQRLVKRDSKGHFVKGTPIIKEVKQRNYGSGTYNVGYVNGKAIVRQKIGKNVNWWEQRKDTIANRKIFRSSYVLNNIPLSVTNQYFKYAIKTGRESWTIGFRINCFSHNKSLLTAKRENMKKKLIDFIEEIVKYRKDEWWFDSYFGYEAPTLVNAFRSEDNRYYLTLENPKGQIIIKREGRVTEL